MSLFRGLAGGAVVFALFAPFALAPPGPVNSELVTHEWGTFTSVADEDGNPVEWASLVGKPDLPCFIEHLGAANLKGSTPSFVRMETPVIYFYSPHPLTLSVRVKFPHGLITEWYPRASGPEKPGFGEIHWDSIRVSPEQQANFPSSHSPSRYFAARNTDSIPLSVNGQQEKFIFYRGVGNFSIPLRPRFVTERTIELRNTQPGSIPLVILFDNRQGRVGYRVVNGLKDSIELDTPDLTGNLDDLRQLITNSLLEFGLYKKEARAMLDTWQDSWFEEGTRAFYIVPRERVDSALPLHVTPAPASVTRVFVGRVEVLSPWVGKNNLIALSTGDTATLQKFGRFLDPFIKQLQASGTLIESPAAAQYLQDARQQIAREFTSASCVR